MINKVLIESDGPFYPQRLWFYRTTESANSSPTEPAACVIGMKLLSVQLRDYSDQHYYSNNLLN